MMIKDLVEQLNECQVWDGTDFGLVYRDEDGNLFDIDLVEAVHRVNGDMSSIVFECS